MDGGRKETGARKYLLNILALNRPPTTRALQILMKDEELMKAFAEKELALQSATRELEREQTKQKTASRKAMGIVKKTVIAVSFVVLVLSILLVSGILGKFLDNLADWNGHQMLKGFECI
jgi:hypothetical protein